MAALASRAPAEVTGQPRSSRTIARQECGRCSTLPISAIEARRQETETLSSSPRITLTWHSFRARTPQIMRRYVGKPESLAYCFTTCQTNRSVTPSPQCLPARQTHRNSLPVESGCSHPQVDARFDTFENRHDSNLAAFADQINYRRTFLTLL